MSLAGIYSVWKDPESGQALNTVALVVTDANELIGHIHNSAHRMPVVLDPDEQTRWIDGEPTLILRIALIFN